MIGILQTHHEMDHYNAKGLHWLINLYVDVLRYMFRRTQGSGLLRLWVFQITLRHTTLGRTLQNEWQARHRQTTLKKTDNHVLRGFAPAIPTSERTQTNALDRRLQGRSYRHTYLWLRSCSCYVTKIHYFQCNATNLDGATSYVTVTVFPNSFLHCFKTRQPFDTTINFCGKGRPVRQEGRSCSTHADWPVCFYAVLQKCNIQLYYET